MNVDNIRVTEHIKITIYALLRKLHLIGRKDFLTRYENYSSKVKKEIFQQIAPQNTLLSVISSETKNLRAAARGTIGILTSPYTEFIALCVSEVLTSLNIRTKIFFEYEANDDDDMFYIVIAPVYFSTLPKNYFAFNVEQCVADRWFTKNYFDKLNNAYGVLDYSLTNIEFLNRHNVTPGRLFYAKLFPRPLKVLDFDSKATPILFYGSLNQKRKKILERLGQKFPIKIIDNSFHEEMRHELDKAQIVLNIHYYENALLETTRLCEAMSHGCLVISERGSNNEEYPELEELVDFVDVDDVDALERRIQYWLDNQDLLHEKLTQNNERIKSLYKGFEFFIGRFLLYYDLVSFETFYRHMHAFFDLEEGKICIGLPESTDRVRYFASINSHGFKVFPALKFPIGWIGCGMTYKFLARKALDEGRTDLIICEDDVEFLPDFAERFTIAEEYFKQSDADALSGFIVDLHSEAKISKIDDYKGVEFITTDRMVSMVFGHYSRRFLEAISLWDDTNDDLSNTIDRYLETHMDLKITFANPFLVGHNENQFSTIWKFKNDTYKTMLENSLRRIEEKKKNYFSAIRTERG